MHKVSTLFSAIRNSAYMDNSIFIQVNFVCIRCLQLFNSGTKKKTTELFHVSLDDTQILGVELFFKS
jgi:hypothetical protein